MPKIKKKYIQMHIAQRKELDVHKTKQKRDKNRTTTSLVLDSSMQSGRWEFRQNQRIWLRLSSVFESRRISFFKIFLVILNGRVGDDVNPPKLTCKNSSTVDYVISTAYNFDFISSFRVLDFDHLYSDAHCPLELGLNIRDANSKTLRQNIFNQNSSTPKVKLWDENKPHLFAENLNQKNVNKLVTQLDEISNSSQIQSTDIDSVVSQIETLFISTAESSFGYHRETKRTENLDKP